MATIPHTTAHISTSPLNPSAFPFATSTKRAKKFPQVFRCALSTPKWQQSSSSRRLVSISLLASHLFTFPNQKTLEVDQPQFANCRSLLRSGPAASLRVNIRAVAQYASDAGSGNTAFNDVDQCLRALEELDSLLLHASRNEPDASVKSMRAKISVALDALDSLLNTVPPDVLNKGKAIADAYRSPEEEKEPEILDPELKELESIL
ncbi:uncharacterized protein LOC8258582 isoform X2 [Ricinus communis]|uniref:uncharacterized protein LOC8258582 isoform X2 n=1 Tax=Ricinus communis TaxID=3988 RepID=UPI00201A569C|nr:uncharacterized protein LOC8258582 isoform X2 [Ricinus communis]